MNKWLEECARRSTGMRWEEPSVVFPVWNPSIRRLYKKKLRVEGQPGLDFAGQWAIV